jgi:DNA-binding LacI/PurR family transcriptional regulator
MSKYENVTIADVAKAAGVSVSTVSRILNGKQDVAQATRERVQQVISELGFIPHAQAQRLRAGRTHNLALLFPTNNPGDFSYNALETEFIVGAATAANKNGFFFNLLTTPVTTSSLLSLYRSAHIDGLVLMQIYADDWRVNLLRDHGLPFVMIGHCDDSDGLTFIDLDFEASVFSAFDHLVSLGHQNIGFIALPNELRMGGYGPAVRGWAGYEHALKWYRLNACYREVSYSAQEIYDATLNLLDEHPELTGIVTTHELGSLSIIQALTTRGRSIPADCSIVALMTEKIAELSTPPMTHIEFPSYFMGYEAVQMLIRNLEGESSEPEQVLIQPKLLLGSSTTEARSLYSDAKEALI